MSTVGVLGVPSSIGARRAGTEKAPAALRAAGLVASLQDVVGTLRDYGDLREVVFQPDTANPRSQNLDRVCEVVADVSRHTDAIVADGSMPFILGGDCTVSIGVLASLARKHERLGLIYFDGDLDLNTPEVTPSGIFDGMVLAHITGKGAPKLAGIGPRCPLVPEHQVAVFGFNPDAGWIDPYELEALAKSSMIQFSVSDIRASANAQARKALSQLESRSDAILLHFDVDVLDAEEFPADRRCPQAWARSRGGFRRSADILGQSEAGGTCGH